MSVTMTSNTDNIRLPKLLRNLPSNNATILPVIQQTIRKLKWRETNPRTTNQSDAPRRRNTNTLHRSVPNHTTSGLLQLLCNKSLSSRRESSLRNSRQPEHKGTGSSNSGKERSHIHGCHAKQGGTIASSTAFGVNLAFPLSTLLVFDRMAGNGNKRPRSISNSRLNNRQSRGFRTRSF